MCALFIFVPIFEAVFPNLNNIFHKNEFKKFNFLFNLIISSSLIIFFISITLYQFFNEIFWIYLFEDLNNRILANKIFFNFLFGYFLLSFSFIIFTFLKIKGIMKMHTIFSLIWSAGIILSFYFSLVKNSDPIMYSSYWILVNLVIFIIFLFVNLYKYSSLNEIKNFIVKNFKSFLLFIVFYYISLNINISFNNLFLDTVLMIILFLVLLLIFILSIKDLRIFLIKYYKENFLSNIG